MTKRRQRTWSRKPGDNPALVRSSCFRHPFRGLPYYDEVHAQAIDFHEIKSSYDMRHAGKLGKCVSAWNGCRKGFWWWPLPFNDPATAIWAQQVVCNCTYLQPYLPILIYLANMHMDITYICRTRWCDSSLAVYVTIFVHLCPYVPFCPLLSLCAHYSW